MENHVELHLCDPITMETVKNYGLVPYHESVELIRQYNERVREKVHINLILLSLLPANASRLHEQAQPANFVP